MAHTKTRSGTLAIQWTQRNALAVDRATAARLLGSTVHYLDALLDRGKIQRAGRGQVSVESICAHLRRRVDDGSVTNRRFKEEQTRFRRLKADLAELELKLKNGEAVLTERIIAEDNRALMALRDALMDVSRRAPEQCSGLDVRGIAAMLDGELRRVLTDFHRLITSPLPEDWKAKYVRAVEAPNDVTYS